MRLRVLGSHGGTSSEHQGVSFLLGERVAIDAGVLAGALTLEEQSRVDTVLVSHSHLDHVADLGAMCDVRSLQGGVPLTVAGRAETIAALKAHFFNDVLWPDFSRIPMSSAPEGEEGVPTLCYRELALEATVELDADQGMTVTPVSVDHTVPSCGYLVAQGGVAIAYTGDTGPTERFWQVVNARDDVCAVVTEVSFPNRMEELAGTSGHLTPSLLARELDRLDRAPSAGVFIYGLKPVFAQEISAELSPMIESGRVELLRAGDTVDIARG